ncbi:UBN2 domain-containing protein [Artemisia annua]|uniref:UBN2 domain-containing protein n=1 Tax=Artemisia annua TaxID=35608 RepID=A0A2U1LHZ6_ARTAN|nr:UBN2 domain-containing protein [Artemisia annua]
MFWQRDKPDEYMYERYIGTINSLKALGKSYTNGTYVEIFLSALPPEWNVEVKAILGSENLSLLSLEDVLGSLKTVKKTVKKRRLHH